MKTHRRISPDTQHSYNYNRMEEVDRNQNVELNLFGNDSDENGSNNDSSDMGIGHLFADLPSNLDMGRSLHVSTASRKSLRRRKSTRPGTAVDGANNELEDVIDIIDTNEKGEKELMKSMAVPMDKRKSVRRIQATRKRSAMLRGKRLSCWKNFRLQTAMAWELFKVRTKNWLSTLQLWRSPLKEVEGNFGNGVLSYFLFLKSLLFLNILIFIVTFSFAVIPQVLVNYGSLIPLVKTNYTKSICTATEKNFYENRTVSEHLLDFFTGQGYVNSTIMFYSNYAGSITIDGSGLEYDMPLAYLLAGGSYFIVSLLVMVKNLAHGFTESIIESGGFFYSYCNKVFASWDYCITSEKAVGLKCNVIFKDFEAELAEERRLERLKKRTNFDCFKIYTLRLVITLFIMGLLAGSIYAIMKAVEVSTDPTLSGEKTSLKVIMQRWASSLTISALNVVLPLVFEVLTSFEEWSPRVKVAMTLWRAVLLKLASVAVLVITLYTQYGTHNCKQCWENQVGAQMFNLLFIDFFVNVGLTIFTETGRKYVYRYLNCGCDLGHKIGMQEFQIPQNVLDLVYGQSLVWIGTYFAPLIPIIGILKLFILFYVKKISLMYNCKPSSTPYQGARSNYFFTLLLLLTFLLCSVGVGWGLTKIKTSCCGPYSNTECLADARMMDYIGKTIDKWPAVIENIINFVKTTVFIFPLFIIIFLLLYYYHAMTKAHEKMISMLKDQLIMEGRDKHFLMDRLVRANEQKRLESCRETVLPPVST